MSEVKVVRRASDKLLIKFPRTYRIMLRGRNISTLAAKALLNNAVREGRGGKYSANLNRKQKAVGRRYKL